MTKPPTSGPPTTPTAITVAVMPWYRPRSRGETRVPIRANAPAASPPAPMPCRARNSISWTIEWAAPASSEPSRNTTIDDWKTVLRP